MPGKRNEVVRKYCKQCDEPFETPIKRQIFCGVECRKEYNYKHYSLGERGREYRAQYRKAHGLVKYNIGDKKPCDRCGDEFVLLQNSTKICSPCKERAKNRKRSCGWCGLYFIVGKTQKYCSSECALKMRRRQQRDYERNKAALRGITKRGNPIEKQCKWCGSEFSIMTEGAGYKFCSKKCAKDNFNDYARKYQRERRGTASVS